MAIDNTGWEKAGKDQTPKNNAGVTDFNSALTGLRSLISSTSIVGGNNRNIAISNEVIKALQEFKKAESGTTISKELQGILPDVIKMDTNLSPTLPGVITYVKVGSTLLAAPFLFSNREVLQDLEEINLMGANHNFSHITGVTSASVRRLPNSYMTGGMIGDVKESLLAKYKDEGVGSVIIVVAAVIDLEAYPKIENDAERVEQIKSTILGEWESGVRACITKELQKAGQDLGTPFINAKGDPEVKAFGPHGHAVAKAEATQDVLINGVPSGANLAVRLQTSKKHDTYGSNNNQDVSREIVTAYCTVSLTGVPLQAYMNNLQQSGLAAPNFMSMMGSHYPNGYTPLQPVITCSTVKAGAQMGFNNGIASLLMGLYAAMAVNHNYMFTEGLRKPQIGARGNLTNMEIRLKEMLTLSGIPRDPKLEMTEARLKDMDFTSEWIRRNVSKQAAFAADLVNFGRDSAVNNFLIGLTQNAVDAMVNKRVIMAVLDSMTGGAASARLEQNIKDNKGWNLDSPILHASNVMIPVGTWTYNGKVHSLEEVDEMCLYRFCPDNPVLTGKYLQAMYGDTQGTPEKVRQFVMTTNLPSLLGTDVNITGFGSRYYYDPSFCLFLAQVLEKLGTMQATGSMGTVQANLGVFAPGVQFALQAATGASGFVVGTNGTVINNTSGIVYGG